MQMLYAPKNEAARTSNMEIAKTKEKIPEEEKGRPRGWVERPVKGCSPPNEMARSPPKQMMRPSVVISGPFIIFLLHNQ
jgi:hypothetical protein